MNRRKFLKLAAGTAALSIIPASVFTALAPEPTIKDTLEDLAKALQEGSYQASPGNLCQGAALQVESLEPVMKLVTFEDKHIKLHKAI